MHLAIYDWIAGFLVVLLLAYAIGVLPVVLDIPIALRIGLSVVPGLVLYRILRFLGSFHPKPGQSARVGLVLVVAIGLAGTVLYHVWRDVAIKD